MATHDQLVGVTLFFTVLNTITVALRIFARTKLSKGAFGWDDIMLVITYVCFYFFYWYLCVYFRLAVGLTKLIDWVSAVCLIHA